MKPKNLRFPYTWEDRRPLIKDNILYIPDYYFNHQNWIKEEGLWNPCSNKNPVYIEFCSGNGEWIINQAISKPYINWVAVEMDFPRVRKIWSKRTNRSLNNLFIVCGKAQEFISHYAGEDFFAKAFVHFPDPWPRKKHAKHRLLQSEFLLSLQHSLYNNGELHLLTDAEAYVEESIKAVKDLPAWRYLYEFPHFITHKEQIGSSWFHRLWQEKGREIFHMVLINKKRA